MRSCKNKPLFSFKLKPLVTGVKIAIAGLVVTGAVNVNQEAQASESRVQALNAVRSGFKGVAVPELGTPNIEDKLDRRKILNRIQALAEQYGNNAPKLPVFLKDEFGDAVRFDGADLPVVNGNTLEITQTDSRATLHWDSFDIGSGYKVVFIQPERSSIALNRVLGSADLRSFIDGNLEANGRVILINQNGFIFGKNSVVNTQSLIVSTLDMDDVVFNDIGFTQVGALQQAPAFSNDGGEMGEILVHEGAAITSGKNGRIMMFAPLIANGGDLNSPEGQIVLAASEDEIFISQDGEKHDDIRGLVVSVPTGGEVHNVGSLIAERGNVSILGLAVNQSGIARANTTVSLNGSVHLRAGDSNGNTSSIQDDGFVSATRYGYIYFGEDSEISITPDATADDQAPDKQDQDVSDVLITGRNIFLDEGAKVVATGGNIDIKAKTQISSNFNEAKNTDGATSVWVDKGVLLDASGDDSTIVSVARNFVEVEARGNELADSPLQREGAIRGKTLTVDLRKGTEFLNEQAARDNFERGISERLSTGGEVSIQSEGSITVSKGAKIDVSGGKVTHTGASVSSSYLIRDDGKIINISEADPNRVYLGVFGDSKNGLVNSNGLFYKNEQGYIEGKDAGSITIAAPSIALNGSIDAGTVSGRFQREKPDFYSNSGLNRFSRPYDQLPSGGRAIINNLNLDLHDLIIGESSSVPITNNHPESTGAATVLSASLFNNSGLEHIAITNLGRVIVNDDLNLEDHANIGLVGTQVIVDGDISARGGNVFIDSRTSEEVDESEAITLLDLAENRTFFSFGDYSLLEQDLDISFASISGDINVSGRWTNDSPVVNNGVARTPIVTDGGTIKIQSANELRINEDSVLNVNSGAYLNRIGELAGGNAGKIELKSFNAPDLNSLDIAGVSGQLIIDGELKGFGFGEGGALSITAPAVEIGGVTPLFAQEFSLVGQEIFDSSENGTLTIDAGLFQKGGFQSYEIDAVKAGLNVSDGSVINLVTPKLQIQKDNSWNANLAGLANNRLGLTRNQDRFQAVGQTIRSGQEVEEFANIAYELDHLIKPTDLSLSAVGVAGTSNLNIGKKSQIIGKIGSTIDLSASTNLYIDGTISAPAGEIQATLEAGEEYNVGIHSRIGLGSHARLLAQGAATVFPEDGTGRRFGQVYDSGSVSLIAKQGAIISDPDSIINVDAVSAELNLASTQANRISTLSDEPIALGGKAGEIHLSVAETLIYQGKLSAQGVLSEEAGKLFITLDPNTRRAPTTSFGVTTGINAEAKDVNFGETVAKIDDYNGPQLSFMDSIDPELYGTAFVPVSQIDSGGFDSLSVKVRSMLGVANPLLDESIPVIEFNRDINLALARQIVLDAPVIRADGDVDVTLRASYVDLGSSVDGFYFNGVLPSFSFVKDANGNNISVKNYNGTGLTLNPQAGGGDFSVRGNLVQLTGELAFQGFGEHNELSINNNGLSGESSIKISSSGDIRFTGNAINRGIDGNFSGSLHADGDVLLAANRIYGSTLTNYSVDLTSESTLAITRNGFLQQAAPLSLGSQLAFSAGDVFHNGSLYAPLGELLFSGTDSVVFGNQSFTSTSAADVYAPFLRVENGQELVANFEGINTDTVVFSGSAVEGDDIAYDKSLPEQGIEITSDGVDVRVGARIDVRGGTDSFATEFIPGTGGSTDILSALIDGQPNGAFAIVPGITQFAPYDPLETPSAITHQGLRVGDTIIIDTPVDGLPAGEYAILPAQYALYGGYLVTPDTGVNAASSGRRLTRDDGAPIVTGRYGVAGTDIESSHTIGFVIENGDRVRNRAEYLEVALEDLYDNGIRSPIDAGILSIRADNSLNLSGAMVPGNQLGLGSELDIVSDAIAIVDRADYTPDGGVQLIAQQLESFGADSYLIGGRREVTEEGLLVYSTSDEVILAEGASLSGPEIMLTADQVVLEEGASLSSQDTRSGVSRTVILAEDDSSENINGDAAFVGVSNNALILQREGVSGSNEGVLHIAENTKLSAQGSIVADVAGDFDFSGDFNLGESGLLGLGSSEVHLGETEGKDLSGLILSNELLTGLKNVNLRIRSDNELVAHGELKDENGSGLKFRTLDLDARTLLGEAQDGRAIVVNAEQLRLSNSSGSAMSDSEQLDSGVLELVAQEIEFADGEFAVDGYSEVALNAAKKVVLDGAGIFSTDSNLNVTTPLLTSNAGSDYAIQAQGADLAIESAGAVAQTSEESGLGAQLSLLGENVLVDTAMVLSSGVVSVFAENDVVLGENALVDVSGLQRDFGTYQVVTAGGAISLFSESGDVVLESGSIMDISTPVIPEQYTINGEETIDSGLISVVAENGALTIEEGASFLSGDHGGRFLLRSDQLSVMGNDTATAYGDLNQLLGVGFNEERNISLLNQGILLSEGQTVAANIIKAVSEHADVVIQGTLDVSGLESDSSRADAGLIVLAAGDSVVLDSTARLLATGASNGKGGKVILDARDSDVDDPTATQDSVQIVDGAIVDLSGGVVTETGVSDNLIFADRELGGRLIVNTRWLDQNTDGDLDTIVLGALDGEIIGASQKHVVPTKEISLVDGEIDAADIELWRQSLKADYDQTIAQYGAASVNSFVITPGLEITSQDNITLLSDWNFQGNYESGGWHFDDGEGGRVAGYLSLLAEQDIRIKGDLSDSVFNVYNDSVFEPHLIDALDTTTESWSFNITAGRQASADITAYSDGVGDISIGLVEQDILSVVEQYAQISDIADPITDSFIAEYLLEGSDMALIGAFDTMVRTGTGDIDLNAGNDIVFENTAFELTLTDTVTSKTFNTVETSRNISVSSGSENLTTTVSHVGPGSFFGPGVGTVTTESYSGVTSGAVYTAGRNLQLSEEVAAIAEGSLNYAMAIWLGGGTNFAIDGGDVTVNAGGNLHGGGITNPSDWQPRIGESRSTGEVITNTLGAVPTHWGLALHNFRNGIGVLGGGKLSANINGDVAGVTVAAPTTGRAVDNIVADSNNPNRFAVGTEITEIAGGGTINLKIGGELTSSAVYLGDGIATIDVNGSVGKGTDQAIELYTGLDSQISVRALDDIKINSIQDPTTIALSEKQVEFGQQGGINVFDETDHIQNDFFTMTNAGVLINSYSGDVTIDTKTEADFVSIGRNVSAPNLTAISTSGNLIVDSSLTFFPAADSSVTLLANQNIIATTKNTEATRSELRQPDINPELLPSVDSPELGANYLSQLAESDTPIHSNDTQKNVIIAKNGSISTTNIAPWEIHLTKQSYIEAGEDISNVFVSVQNINETDISSIIAGRDIIQETKRNPSGNLIDSTLSAANAENKLSALNQFRIAGPGAVEVLAGREINLGTSGGIETIGDTKNALLHDSGADLIVMAGLGGKPLSLDAFIQTYLINGYAVGERVNFDNESDIANYFELGLTPEFSNSSSALQGESDTLFVARYDGHLADFLNSRSVQYTQDNMVDVFKSLPLSDQRLFVSDVFFNELQSSGRYAVLGSDDYSRGFDAISTLYPDSDPSGSITMLNSQIQTLDGGEIKMMVPGGFINAGSVGGSSLSKPAGELGIVSFADDPVSIFVDGDLAVNSTRVFALQSDLLVWSSNGNIDAGKGAKTVSQIPPPIIRINPQTGETEITYPPAIEGSGLRGVDVDLFAPSGAIIAGDAGISARNATLGAVEVIGADNIDVSGVAIGVPQSGPVAATFDSSSNVAASSTKIAESAASGFEENNVETDAAALGILSVEIDGFGEIRNKSNNKPTVEEKDG